MPMERTRAGRIRQAARWLALHYPAAYPVRLEIKKLGHMTQALGECQYKRRRLTIRIDARLKWYHAIEVLIHEWAHAHTWRLDEPHHHGPMWATAYGAIYRHWYDDGGAEESRGL